MRACLLLQRVARVQNLVAKIVGVDNAGEAHVVGLSGTAAGGFEFEGAQMEMPQNRASDERHILNIFQWDGFFHGHQNAFAVAQCFFIEVDRMISVA